MGIVRASQTYGTPFFYEEGVSAGPGRTLLERFPLIAALTDPGQYVVYKDDFADVAIDTNTIPGFTFTSVTSGSITQDTTNPNGVLLISAGAATAGVGVNWQMNNVPFKVAAGKPLAFEVIGKFTGLSNLRVQTFIGLAATSTAIIASGAFASVNRVGFQGITTTGVLTSVARQGGTAEAGTGLTLVNDTVYRFGLYATSSQVDFYVDGSIVSSITSQIPTVALAPSIVVQAAGTDTPVFNLDSMVVAGYRS